MGTLLDQQAQEFWFQKVKALPFDALAEVPKGADPEPAPEVHVVTLDLDGPLLARLEQISNGKAVNKFVVCLSALGVMLCQYGLRHPAVSGLPLAGSSAPDAFLFFDFPAGSRQTFRSLAGDIQRQCIEAFRHADYRLAHLLDALAANDRLEDPEFYARIGFGMEGLTRLEGGPFDAAFFLLGAGGGHRVSVRGKASRYTSAFVRQLGDHYRTALEKVLADAGAPLPDFSLLTPAERERVLYTFNATDAPFARDKTLVQLFEEQVRRHPEKTALSYGAAHLSYARLNRLSNQVAHFLLREEGVRADDPVGVVLERTEWMVIAILGILKAGGAYVPIDPANPDDRVQYLLADASVKCFVTNTSLHTRFEAFRPLFIGKAALDDYPAENPPAQAGPGHLAYVIYTSGSTGKPKGVMIEHTGAVNRIAWMWQYYGFGGGDVFLQKTPYVFDVSVWELFLPLCFGARLVLCEKEAVYDPRRLAGLIGAQGVTTVHFVPSAYEIFLKTTGGDQAARLAGLRHVMVSGETLRPRMVHDHYARFAIPLHNLYGPTEASVDVTQYTTRPADTVVPIGRPIDNTQLYVLNDRLQPLPVGIAGQIGISGVGLARGYLNAPALTAEKFVDHPFRPGEKLYLTGDIGKWRDDGELVYLSRKDEQLKIRGFRIEPGEIENTLLTHPLVVYAVVMARVDDTGAPYLVAFYQSRNALDGTELQKFLLRYLPDYMVPGFFCWLPDFPVTKTGKIDRQELHRIYEQQGAGHQATGLPRNEVETKLLLLWQQLLPNSTFGTENNFFESGGTSLKVVQLSELITQAYPKKIMIHEIYSYPTIRKQADLILSRQTLPEKETAEIREIDF